MRQNNTEQTYGNLNNGGTSYRNGLTYLLIGGGIGAAIALLFAPKSGTELRGEIADVTKKGYGATLEKAKDLKVQSADLIQTVKDKADVVYDYAAGRLAKNANDVTDLVAGAEDGVINGVDNLASAADHVNSRYAGRKSSNVV